MANETTNQIQFLGTGGGDFFYPDTPDIDRNYLKQVRERGGRNLRYASQALVAPDILVDFFDDRQIRRFRVTPKSIRHLLITHCHYDHLNPVAIREFSLTLPHPLEIYGIELVRDSLNFHAAYRWDEKAGRFRSQTTQANYRYHTVQPERSFRLGETTVTPVLANHSINKGLRDIPFMPLEHVALNYVIERNGKTLFYGLDSSYTLPGTLEFLKQFSFDVAVLDVSFADYKIDPAKSGHHDFKMIAETLTEFREAGIITEETKIVASHLAVSYTKPHDDLVAEALELGIILAYDGMVLKY